jgi:hypothetical protein
MGFFQRRADNKAAAAKSSGAREMVAQLAARDLAVGVLVASEDAGMSLVNLRTMLRVVLADAAPRQAIDAGIARAIALDAELLQAFPGHQRGILRRALGAAVVDREELNNYTVELGLEAEVLRRRFGEFVHLSAWERTAITADR